MQKKKTGKMLQFLFATYTCVQKKIELFNSAPTSTDGALQLLSAPSGRF
jgi:hypothetical protein